jgi:hypothetical protein
MEIKEKYKKIYNCFLKHYRNGEPFQQRKDFSSLNGNTRTDLLKVGSFLEKYPQINWDEFFGAFRFLHPDEKTPNLNFFATRAAIKIYNTYKNIKELENPENQMEEIKKSYHYIGMFCLEYKLNLDDYIKHKAINMYSWIKHYRDRRINLYSLMELGDIQSQLSRLPEDELQLYANDLIQKINKIKLNYRNSTTVKNYVKNLKQKTNFFLETHLTLT